MFYQHNLLSPKINGEHTATEQPFLHRPLTAISPQSYTSSSMENWTPDLLTTHADLGYFIYISSIYTSCIQLYKKQGMIRHLPRLAALLQGRFSWPNLSTRIQWSQRYRQWRQMFGPKSGQTFIAVPRVFSYFEPWRFFAKLKRHNSTFGEFDRDPLNELN